MELQVLYSAGFEEKEARIYLALLTLGTNPASKIAEHLGYERTSTYYLLLRMMEKGYVSAVVKGKAKQFSATSAQKISNMLKERQASFQLALPQFEALSKQSPSELHVETIRGKAAMDILLRELLETKKEWVGFGIDDEDWWEQDPVGLARWLKLAPQYNSRERLLTYKGAKILPSTTTKYRVIDKKYFNPFPIVVYDDKVVFIMWGPSLQMVFMENKGLADSFMKNFELLWKEAEPADECEEIDVSKYNH